MPPGRYHRISKGAPKLGPSLGHSPPLLRSVLEESMWPNDLQVSCFQLQREGTKGKQMPLQVVTPARLPTPGRMVLAGTKGPKNIVNSSSPAWRKSVNLGGEGSYGLMLSACLSPPPRSYQAQGAPPWRGLEPAAPKAEMGTSLCLSTKHTFFCFFGGK